MATQVEVSVERMKYLLMVVWVFTFAMSSVAISTTEGTSPSSGVKVYGYALEFRLQEQGGDQYNHMFQEMARQGLSFELVVQPFTRIIRDIGTHTECVFPVSINAIRTAKPRYKDLPLVSSNPIDHISLRVFTRSDKPTLTSLSELDGKKVAVWDGLDADIFLKDVRATVETTPNELVRLKMLNKDRIDAILGFTPDVNLAAEVLGIPMPQYANSLALFRDEGASVVCHDTPRNREFILQFNQILAQLKESGKLREVLGPHADLAP